MTPTLKSLPYFSLALSSTIKRPVGRFVTSSLRLLLFFMPFLSTDGPFFAICEVCGPLENSATLGFNTLLHPSKRYVLSSEEVLATGPSTFVAHAKVSLIFLHK